MASRKPVIGISVAERNNPAWQAFSEAVYSYSGEPVQLLPEEPPGSPDSRLDDVFAHLNGLLLTGGGDIAPSLYGDIERTSLRFFNPIRDELEISLCRRAFEKNMPLLGVCRGVQVMAVAAGGTLIQHIPDSVPQALPHESPNGDAGHMVRIEKNSIVMSVFENKEFYVNSTHHQAVATPGRCTASAQSADGIIEAIELPGTRWIIGVQWHPERMWQFCPIQLRLVETLVDVARASKQ